MTTTLNRGMKIYDSNHKKYDTNSNNATTIEIRSSIENGDKYSKSVFRLPNVYKIKQDWNEYFRDFTRTKHQREVLWFLLAQLIGTVFFFILFESLYQLTAAEVESAENVFSLAYVCAYWISILWQHALNRWLVRSLSTSASFCDSLCYTYAIYSLSLCITTICSSILLRLFAINPNVLAIITLPFTGYLNWILLKYFTSSDFL